MSLKTLDRTQWSFDETLAHVQKVTVARGIDAAKLLPEPTPTYQPWNLPQDPKIAWKAQGETELLVALRDGDLIAQGRYTEERPNGWGFGASSGFGLHSGYHTSIRPEQWREGRYLMGKLTARDWEFIDIRMPCFMVKAIWPDHIPEVDRNLPTSSDAVYTTPYLELMQAAIARFGLTEDSQSKKENLSDWFLEQDIDGEPVSQNLADAMATLIRLPSAQRGGAKRMSGPVFRKAG